MKCLSAIQGILVYLSLICTGCVSTLYTASVMYNDKPVGGAVVWYEASDICKVYYRVWNRGYGRTDANGRFTLLSKGSTFWVEALYGTNLWGCAEAHYRPTCAVKLTRRNSQQCSLGELRAKDWALYATAKTNSLGQIIFKPLTQR